MYFQRVIQNVFMWSTLSLLRRYLLQGLGGMCCWRRAHAKRCSWGGTPKESLQGIFKRSIISRALATCFWRLLTTCFSGYQLSVLRNTHNGFLRYSLLISNLFLGYPQRVSEENATCIGFQEGGRCLSVSEYLLRILEAQVTGLHRFTRILATGHNNNTFPDLFGTSSCGREERRRGHLNSAGRECYLQVPEYRFLASEREDTCDCTVENSKGLLGVKRMKRNCRHTR